MKQDLPIYSNCKTPSREEYMQHKTLLIYPQTNKHLGLWNDLINDERVILRCSTEKKFNKLTFLLFFIYYHISKRLHWHPYHRLWFEYHDIYRIIRDVEHIIIIDGALNSVKISELKKCKQLNPSLKFSLFLINSMNAHSPTMRGVHRNINHFKWDNIYTFDAEDARKYGYTHLGFNYYSFHEITASQVPDSDVFFVGGLKGGRSQLIYDLYSQLTKCGIKCDFYLMPIDDKSIKQLSGIYYFKGWRPYEEILAHTQRTKCIIEIMQEGQSGATLRYFEAVTMNKKLLTNNPHIKDFPFYNPQWMKIIKTIEDIDIKWITRDEKVDYGYQGEFSPTHLIDYITRKQK